MCLFPCDYVMQHADEFCDFVQEVRQIYSDHGWPGNFCRKECREALREWNRTIDHRLSQSGHDLHKINRQPPGLNDTQSNAESETDFEEEYES
jgi:hypothetical protein